MMLFDILGFSPYIPTSILGLLGIIAAYIFVYSSKNANSRLKEIESVSKKDRPGIISDMLNEFHQDITLLTKAQQYDLIKTILSNKRIYSLIKAITVILLAIGLIIIVLFVGENNENPLPPSNSFNFSSSYNGFDKMIIDKLKYEGYKYESYNSKYNLKLVLDTNQIEATVKNASRIDYFFLGAKVYLKINELEPIDLGITVPETIAQSTKGKAREELSAKYHKILMDNFQLIYNEIKDHVPIEN